MKVKGLILSILFILSLTFTTIAQAAQPGEVVRVDQQVAPGVTFFWKAYVGISNVSDTCHPLIFGDRIYHASNGDEVRGDLYARLYCFSWDGKLLWSFQSPDGGNTSINGVVACPDFVVVGCGNGYVYAISHDGEMLWKFRTGGDVKSFSIGDLDGDGRIEVVMGSSDNHLYCLGGESSKLRWKFETGHHVASSPATGDLDGDGKMEVVVGSVNGYLYCLEGESGVMRWKFKTDGEVVSSPAIGDLDGDGRMEVVVGSRDDYLYCLEGENGVMRWKFKTDGSVYSSPAIGDLDGDGKIEVTVGSYDDYLYCMKEEGGEVKWRFKTDGGISSSPGIGDLDGDGRMEVVVGSRDDYLYCLEGENGVMRWKFKTDGSVYSSPAIGDLDGDGRTEVVVASFDGWLYLLKIEGAVGEILWARWHGDGFGTGLLKNALSYGEAARRGMTDRWMVPLNRPPRFNPIGEKGVKEGEKLDLTLSAHDPDGDTIRFSCGNLPEGAKLSNDGAFSWKPKPGQVGKYELKLTASDGKGGIDTTTLTITVIDATPPEISLQTAPELKGIGEKADISVKVHDNSELKVVKLRYRTGGDETFDEVEMRESGDIFSASMEVPPEGLVYYVIAEDKAGNIGKLGSKWKLFGISAKGKYKMPSSPPPRDFAMICIPLVGLSSLIPVLSSTWGSKEENWIIGRWSPELSDYDRSPEFRCGWSYWISLKNRYPSPIITGTMPNPAKPFVIELEMGWNQLGNPFPFPVRWGNVLVRRGKERGFAVVSDWVENGIWRWLGWEGEPGTERYEFRDSPDILLEPWEGFWLWAEEDELELIIPPLSVPVEGAPAPKRNPPLWKITLMIGGDEIELGVAEGAREGYDRNDLMCPPNPIGAAEVNLLTDGRKMKRNLLPARGEEWLWRMALESKGEREIKISWQMEGVPAKYRVYLEDVERGMRIAMRKSGRYTVKVKGRREMWVRVTGRKLGMELEEMKPRVTELMPCYPNPGNPEIWVPYILSERSEVRVSIYDLSGRLIRRLALGKRDAGVYVSKGRAAYWDGQNERGERVASGIYVVELLVGRKKFIRRIAISK
jgi:outer membrane protein assembly factor BamB